MMLLQWINLDNKQKQSDHIVRLVPWHNFNFLEFCPVCRIWGFLSGSEVWRRRHTAFVRCLHQSDNALRGRGVSRSNTF